jgi:hypothetical protein
MSMPWRKIWKNTLTDEKITFLVRRFGHECVTFWIGLITKADDDGVLRMDPEVFAQMCVIEDSRYAEIVGIFVKYKLIEVLDDNELLILNWEKYQYSESHERVARHREEKKERKIYVTEEKHECNAPVTGCNGDVMEVKRECNAKVTGELEVEVDEEGGGARTYAREFPPTDSEKDQEELPRPFTLIREAVDDIKPMFRIPESTQAMILEAYDQLGERRFCSALSRYLSKKASKLDFFANDFPGFLLEERKREDTGIPDLRSGPSPEYLQSLKNGVEPISEAVAEKFETIKKRLGLVPARELEPVPP